MGELVTWWQRGTGDAVLDATVAHSWLTHIHPFVDGNGRLARLMINAALVQSGYPALMLRSVADRERYLDALARSDEGDILPMYDFVTEVLARSIRVMAKEGYVASVIGGELLGTKNQRFTHWRRSAGLFAHHLTARLERERWGCSPQGYPDVLSYGLLEEQHPEGNCWYLKVHDTMRRPRWLLWFGYTPGYVRGLVRDLRPYPAIYFSIRDEDPASVHPYRWVDDPIDAVPTALVIAPFTTEPAKVFWGRNVRHYSLEGAAEVVAGALVSA